MRAAGGTILLFLLASLAMGQAKIDSARVEPISTDGAVRPFEAVRSLLHWNVASPDLFSGWIDGGLYGYYGPQPEIFIDGLEADGMMFGWLNLNMLPLFLKEVTSVRHSTRAGIHRGTRTVAGWLDFQLASPDSGWSTGTSAYLGNESGDPGPWAYDSSRVTPNVDRWGPDVSLAVSYAGDGWYVRGMGAGRKNQPTDLISMRRLNNQRYIPETGSFHPMVTRSGGALLETGYRNRTWKMRIRGLYGRNEDFPFLPFFGREVPADIRYRQLAAEIYHAEGSWSWSARYLYDLKEAGYRANILGFDLDRSSFSHKAVLEAAWNGNRLKLNPGVILRKTGDAGRGLREESALISTLYFRAAYTVGENMVLKAGGTAEEGYGARGLSYFLESRISPFPFLTLEPRLFHEQLPPWRGNDFAWLSGRGYEFPAGDPLVSGPVHPLKTGRLSGAELVHRYRLSPGLSVALEHRWIRHHRLGIPWQKVVPDLSYDIRPGEYTFTYHNGSRMQNLVTFTHKAAPWRQEGGILLQHVPGGENRYRRYFAQIPALRFHYSLRWRAAPDTRIEIRARYHAPTRWREFEAVEGREYRSLVPFYPRQTGIFRTETPSWLDLELRARKWFWKRRFSLQISLQNLLGAEVRMHPLGAEKSTLLQIRAAVRLP